MARSSLPWSWLLPVSLIPAVLAVAQLGRIHPDEVYQSLEPAYAKAFGYGILAWEWQTGLRNWAVPLLFAGLLRLSAWLGITHPLGYRAVLELPQWGLHLAALVSVYRFAERRVGDPRARWVIPLVGLFAPVLTFAGRTMGESFSAAFLVLALERLDRHEERAWQYLLGGVFLGMAVVVRYPSGVMVVAALLWLVLARRFRALRWGVWGGLLVAGLLGALDAFTWGKPFHSLLAYLDFNVLSGKAALQFGQEGRAYYLLPLLLYLPLWGWPGAVYAVARRPLALSLPVGCAAVYLVAISFTAHKEVRFLYPALVLLAMGAAPFFLALIERQRVDLAAALTAWALCASAGPFFLDTPLSVQRPDQFRAIVQASRGDASGLLIVNEGLWGAGGYFYVGKNIPWTTCDWPQQPQFQMAMADPRFNRAVTYDERGLSELKAAGFTVTEVIGRTTWLSR